MPLPAQSPNRTLSRVDAVPSPSFPRRFRARVFLYILTLSLGTSAASVGIYYWRQLGFVERDQALRATGLLGALAVQAELGAYASDAALCELAARRTFSQESKDVVVVAIYDLHGREIVRFDRGQVPPPAPPAEVFEKLHDAPDAELLRFRTQPERGQAYDDLYAPIVTSTRSPAEVLAGVGGPAPRREVVGIARLGLSLRPAREQLLGMVRWGIFLGVGILVTGILAALLISRQVSRPINALIYGAERLRAGELETRVKIESRDELGQLAHSFNRMARRLNESITALEELNRDLEAEVARRTAEVQRAADFSALLNAPLGQKYAAPEPVRVENSGPIIKGSGPAPIVGGDMEGTLARLLDGALKALMLGTGARAAAALLSREVTPSGPSDQGSGVGKELVLARYRGADLEVFGAPPDQDSLAVGVPFVDGTRTVMPLLLGAQVQGCLVLLFVPARDDLLRFVSQAASQLAIAVSNVRAYAAADQLTRALRERNAALAKQRDQLQEMNRLKSEFLANVSHELRTPLNAIIGYCELIADGIYGVVTGEQRSALAGIDESGQNLLGLINQILDLAKVEAGKMNVYLEDVDVTEVARAVVAEAAPLAKDRPYKVRLFTLPTAVGLRLRTDGAKVKQILTNLVSNAVKFTHEGQVDVTVRAEAGGGCTIVVRDTGIGIKPEDMKIIFEEFRQVDGSYTRQFGGTGLGLAIARRFAQMLGGQITVESAPGLGSTFAFTLPRNAPTPPPVAPMPRTTNPRMAALEKSS